MIVRGFIEPIAKELPMEYAVELNRLMSSTWKGRWGERADFTLATLSEDDVQALSELAGDPVWLRDRRLEALKAFSDLPWPTNRDEEWRFTNPRRFALDRPVVGGGEAAPPSEGIAATQGATANGARFVDGGVVAHTSDGTVTVGILHDPEHEELVRPHLGTVVGADDPFQAANLAAWTCGVVVYVPPDADVTEPIVVTLQVANPGTILARVLVVSGRHSRAKVIVDHVGDAQATVVTVVEAVLEDGAQLDLVTAQEHGEQVDLYTAHRAKVGRDARYRHLEVTLGGRTAYVRPDVWLAAPGADADMLGVYFTTEGQQVEHRTLIRHDASHTRSKYVHKGALQGDSRATWFGNIRIEPHAKATSSDETNRNLILSAGARADTLPFLEITTSDVLACGHHSSVGQIDELALFYLQARGIPRAEAVRLLVLAFFTEILERFGDAAATQVVTAVLERDIVGEVATSLDVREAVHDHVARTAGA